MRDIFCGGVNVFEKRSDSGGRQSHQPKSFTGRAQKCAAVEIAREGVFEVHSRSLLGSVTSRPQWGQTFVLRLIFCAQNGHSALSVDLTTSAKAITARTPARTASHGIDPRS